MRKMLTSPRHKADPPMAWNDIEALPIYAAMLLCFGCAWLAISDSTPTLYAMMLKIVGIVGGLSLRHAWLKLDEDDGMEPA